MKTTTGPTGSASAKDEISRQAACDSGASFSLNLASVSGIYWSARHARNTVRYREARLFRNNHSQAVHIPADFELSGDRIVIRRDDDRLILEPIQPRGLPGLLSSWEALGERHPDVEVRPTVHEYIV